MDKVFSDNTEGQRAAFSCATIAPNGQWVATGSLDGRIQIWDVETRHAFEEYTGHKNAIWSIKFTSDSSAVVSAGEDWTVKVHHIKDPLDLLAEGGSLTLRGPMVRGTSYPLIERRCDHSLREQSTVLRCHPTINGSLLDHRIPISISGTHKQVV